MDQDCKKKQITGKQGIESEALHLPLRRDRHRAGLPGNVDMITGSAFRPAGHPADLPVNCSGSPDHRLEKIVKDSIEASYPLRRMRWMFLLRLSSPLIPRRWNTASCPLAL